MIQKDSMKGWKYFHVQFRDSNFSIKHKLIKVSLLIKVRLKDNLISLNYETGKGEIKYQLIRLSNTFTHQIVKYRMQFLQGNTQIVSKVKKLAHTSDLIYTHRAFGNLSIRLYPYSEANTSITESKFMACYITLI